MLGTVSTLLFVPVVFGMVHAWLARRRATRYPAPSPAAGQ
jgi:hypothetical protein